MELVKILGVGGSKNMGSSCSNYVFQSHCCSFENWESAATKLNKNGL